MLNEEIDFQPAEEFVVSELETLKVLADPLRLSIIEYLSDGPSTVKEIAEKIDKPPTKLYYHFNLLEKHGLIKMVYTRIVSGIVEKHYQSTAKTYRVERGLLSPTSEHFDESLETMLSSMMNNVRADLRDSLVKGVVDTSDEAPAHRRMMLTQGHLKLTPEQANEFYGRMVELLQEFDDRNETDEVDKLITYKLTLVVHPSSNKSSNNED